MTRRALVAVMTLAVLAVPTAALAQQAPFSVSIENLAPDVPQSSFFTYDLAHDAEFRGLTWTRRTGVLDVADLVVEVCTPTGTCVSGNNPDPTVLPAGLVSITVTATISEAAPQGSSGTAAGALVFAAAAGGAGADELPRTGAWLFELFAVAAALISIGASLVSATRSDETEEAAQ